ncbi:MAG: hypothetical protein JW919_04995, partial [Candidatus Omnitrophica bacterium]|nr:hypothetical protein [Candidatus Omnitrophota bacterium]
NNIGATTTQYGREAGDLVIDGELLAAAETLARGGRFEDIPAEVQRRFGDIRVKDASGRDVSLVTSARYAVVESEWTVQKSELKKLAEDKKAPREIVMLDSNGEVYRIEVRFDEKKGAVTLVKDRNGNPISERGPPSLPLKIEVAPYEVTIMGNVLSPVIGIEGYDKLVREGRVDIKNGFTVSVKSAPMVSIGYTRAEELRKIKAKGIVAGDASQAATGRADKMSDGSKEVFKAGEIFGSRNLAYAVGEAPPIIEKHYSSFKKVSLSPAERAVAEAMAEIAMARMRAARALADAKAETVKRIGLDITDINDIDIIPVEAILTQRDIDEAKIETGNRNLSIIGAYMHFHKDDINDATLSKLREAGLSDEEAISFVARANTYLFRNMISDVNKEQAEAAPLVEQMAEVGEAGTTAQTLAPIMAETELVSRIAALRDSLTAKGLYISSPDLTKSVISDKKGAPILIVSASLTRSKENGIGDAAFREALADYLRAARRLTRERALELVDKALAPPTAVAAAPAAIAPAAAEAPAGIEERKRTVERQVAAARSLLEYIQFGNEPRVILLPSKTAMLNAHQNSIKQDMRRAIAKKYGANVSAIFYDGTEAGLKEAYDQLKRDLERDPKTLALAYVREGQFESATKLFKEHESRLKCIQEEMPEKGAMEDAVMHIVLGLGILDYVRRGDTEEYDRTVLLNLIEKLVANPQDVRNLLKADINNLFKAVFTLKLKRLDLREIEDFKRSQDEVLRAL